MSDELGNHSSTTQELIAQGREEGRKEEALRMTCLTLERRFGRLGEQLSQALLAVDTAALEALAFDPMPTIVHLEVRLGLPQEAPRSPLDKGISPHRPPTRVSPLGGYRNTSAAGTPVKA